MSRPSPLTSDAIRALTRSAASSPRGFSALIIQDHDATEPLRIAPSQANPLPPVAFKIGERQYTVHPASCIRPRAGMPRPADRAVAAVERVHHQIDTFV